MNKTIGHLLNRFKINKNMIFALVGESGTGKSFRARLVAERYGLTAIIDDGLLIYGDKIIAGHSAKKEKTYMGAVRVALFDNKDHRDEIARAIKKRHISKVLIIGTSEKMVQKIAMRLQLPPPETIIYIQDIATKEEIEKAIRSRQIEGKHVIPVPSSEIKRSYPQIFSDSIKLFFRRKNVLSKTMGADSKIFEKSIVQPEFSKKGRIEISGAVLMQMVVQAVANFNAEIRIKKMSIKISTRGYKLIITVDVPNGIALTETIIALQKHIIENIENVSGVLIEEINVIIDKIKAKTT